MCLGPTRVATLLQTSASLTFFNPTSLSQAFVAGWVNGSVIQNLLKIKRLFTHYQGLVLVLNSGPREGIHEAMTMTTRLTNQGRTHSKDIR